MSDLSSPVHVSGAQPAGGATPTDQNTSAFTAGKAVRAARRHGAEMLGRFRQIDFKREVWPLDVQSALALARQPAIWAVVTLAALPLFFTTFEQVNQQLVAFSLYFAGVWGLIFRFNIVGGVRIGWGWLAASLLFTSVVGCFVLTHAVYPILPAWYRGMVQSPNSFVSLLGCVLQVGLCEEACKIVPVLGILLVLRGRLRYADIVLLGVFSGLGFAAVENLSYFKLPTENVFNFLVANPGSLGSEDPTTTLHQAMLLTSEKSILLALSRLLSCTFGHAVYCGMFAHFVAQARHAGTKRVPLLAVGWALAATFHGLYDWLWTLQATFPVLVDVIGFMLLKLYIARATASELPEPLSGIEPAAGPNGSQPFRRHDSGEMATVESKG